MKVNILTGNLSDQVVNMSAIYTLYSDLCGCGFSIQTMTTWDTLKPCPNMAIAVKKDLKHQP